MAITLPAFQSPLSVPSAQNNFIAYQSANLPVTGSSSSVTFTAVQQSGRVTIIVANTGTVGAYLASGVGSATAVASTTSPLPSTGTAISPCFYVAAGAIYTLDFVEHTDTFAAITATGTTTLEISVGSGS